MMADKVQCPECGSDKLAVDLAGFESVEVVGWRDGPVLGDEVFYRERTGEWYGDAPWTCDRGHEFATPDVVMPVPAERS